MKHLILLMLAVALGCSNKARQDPPMKSNEAVRSFKSPEEAVEVARTLMKAEKWAELGEYYDLSGTKVDREELKSGRFFVREGPSPRPDPLLAWRYRQPFTPGMKFDHVETTDDPNVVRVVVSREIDQGGGMKQRVRDSFMMRKGAGGWRLLPKVEEKGSSSAMPSPAPTPSNEPVDAAHFRPALADRIAKLPEAKVEALPALLDEMDKCKRSMQVAPMLGTTKPIPYAGVPVAYEPINAELIASVVGQRIEDVLAHNPGKEVNEVLKKAGRDRIDLKYGKIVIHRVDVAGTGPVYFADRPVSTSVVFKEMTPH